MKCRLCGTISDPKSKFCWECGAALGEAVEGQPSAAFLELYGKEVDILFFMDGYSGKVSGIVNPTEAQVGRYRQGVLQRVTIDPGAGNTTHETAATILNFIRQSKANLGEEFNEKNYRGLGPVELKKEYLRLFERILKLRAQLHENQKPAPPKPEKK